MDNIHITERAHNGSVGLDPNRRVSSRSLPLPDSSGHMPTAQIVTVVVHKDENGYGMKVSGDNPVYVQSVREGGAAEKAGLQAGDTIIKVNGEDVIKSTHTEVVALIRSTTHVKLTVKQHPRMLRAPVGSPVPSHQNSSSRPVSTHHHSNTTQITAPQPVDLEKLRQFEKDRVHLIRMMLEKEQTHVEALRSELARLPPSADSSKVYADLASAERTVGRLQNELQTCLTLTSHDGLSASSLSHTLPKSLTTPPSSAYNPQHSVTSVSSLPQSKSANQIFETPPPLPNRNKLNNDNNTSTATNNRSAITRLRANEPQHFDNQKNLIQSRAFYQKSPSQSPVSPECNLVENQLYHSSKLKDEKFDKSDSMLANYYRKNPVSPKHSSVKHNNSKISKRTKGTNITMLGGLGGSLGGLVGGGVVPTNNNFNKHDPTTDIPPPLPPRVPVLIDPDSSAPSVPPPNEPPPSPPSGIIEPDAVNSINKQMSYPLVATCAALVNNSCNSKTPHIVNTHHRTNSSPDPLVLKSPQDMMHRLGVNSESLSDLTDIKAPRCDTWEIMETSGGGGGCVTPPGTPPPPYPSPYQERSPNVGRRSQRDSGDHSDDIHNEEQLPAFTDHPPENIPLLGDASIVLPSTTPSAASITAASSNVTQKRIISMEDELSDQEVEPIEDGPFKSLSRLWEHLAHLAVFLNYILTNCDPSSVLFYLITDLYKEGTAKDMKKWAYEIHSSFLVPGSPLRLKNVDENVAREIDDVLQKEADKEEILRKVFLKARAKAKEELNELLAEFRQKRNAGLGTLYGPPDHLLEESMIEKQVETKIIEEVLQKKLSPYLEDLDQEQPVDPRKYTTAVALSTVFTRIFGLRLGHSDLERLPSFVSKDKSLRNRIIGRRGKMNLRGHHFVAHQYYTVTYCNHCQFLIWGIGPQAYRCTNCHSNIHRHCVKNFEENCPGPLVKKEKGAYPISKIMGRIRPDTRNETKRKSSSTHNFLLAERERRLMEEKVENAEDPDRPQSTASVTRSGSDRRSDISEDTPEPEICDKDTKHDNFSRLPRPKTTPTSINRSESYKEQSQKRRQIKERRKISDPNLSKSNDVEQESGLSYNTNSGSSSNSSLSSGPSLDSPSTSLEAVTAPLANNARVRVIGESDPEAEASPDPSEWATNIPEEILSRLSPSEKKRQDVFNELLQTERSHVRQLRVLENVFQLPLENSNLLTQEQLNLLFPNLDEMLDLHSNFSQALKALRKEKTLVGEVGDTLLNMFDGSGGERFEKAAAEFCARQQIALEWLRERRKKDAKLHNFLTDCEADKTCRRLQLKDLIPTGMLRLTKYPLLFENLAKYTSQCLSDTNSVNPITQQELERVQRALDRSKEILNSVNTAVKKAEDFQRLVDIQRRLDRSGFDKVDQPIAVEFKNIDITKRRLIHEGALCWRISNRQRINLHVLLLEDVILLLQKQDDKYSLKFHHASTPGGTDRSIIISPIIRVSTVLVRSNATDTNSIFLITTAQNGAQMYDLVASSPSEIKQWYKYITEASEACTRQEGRYDRNNTEQNEMAISDETLPRDHHMQTIDENGSQDTTTTNEDSISVKSVEDDVQGAPEQPNTSAVLEAPEQSNTSTVSEEKDKPASNEGVTPPTPSTVTGVHQSSLLLSTEQSALIEPSEVKISVKPAQIAEPVLTPLERLRRTDLEIKRAIAEKQNLVADILSIPRDEFTHIADLASEPNNDKDATELILAAVNQANQLVEAINETLNINEETAIALTTLPVSGCSWSTSRHPRTLGVPPEKLQTISSTLNTQLTQLLKVIKERDEEREKLRTELHKSREQIHLLHELYQLKDLKTEPTVQNDNIELPVTTITSTQSTETKSTSTTATTTAPTATPSTKDDLLVMSPPVVPPSLDEEHTVEI